MHFYAIGDIHGHMDLLEAAHARIAADMEIHGPATIVHLGDLGDRGPDSAAVIEYLRLGIEAGEDWIVLKGNHDRLFTQFLNDPAWHDPGLRPIHSWLHPALGGAATLASYGVHAPQDRPVAAVHEDALARVPQAHRDFLQSRPDHFAIADAFCVHAGIRPGVAFSAQTEQDKLWIRKDFLEDTRDHGALIVHGHTALPEATHFGNRVDLDSSAAYGGPLTAAVVLGREAFDLTPEGRKALLRKDPPKP